MGDTTAPGYSMHRFSEFGDLTAAETRAVLGMAEEPRSYTRFATIRREDSEVNSFFLLLEGWATASLTLADGGRQILKVHLPGDVLGTPSMSLSRAAETLTAITPVVAAAVPLERFGQLLRQHPRVGAFFLLSCQRERVALMDQLASLGRTSAEARLAALLLDLLDRLTPLGEVRGDSFLLRLTQEQIGDQLGLTSVHVNRMMRELEQQQLIARDRQQLTILDRAALARRAGRPVRTLNRAAAWLPASMA